MKDTRLADVTLLSSTLRTCVKPGMVTRCSACTRRYQQSLLLLSNFPSPKYSATENNPKQMIPPLPRHQEDPLQGWNEWVHPREKGRRRWLGEQRTGTVIARSSAVSCAVKVFNFICVRGWVVLEPMRNPDPRKVCVCIVLNSLLRMNEVQGCARRESPFLHLQQARQ